MTVADLPEHIAALESPDQARFERLFATSVTSHRPSPRAAVRMDRSKEWYAAPIVRVSNRWTHEGTAFDLQRQRRTPSVDDAFMRLLQRCQTPGQACSLCPEEVGGTLPTPAPDGHCMILDPRAKFDGYHTLIVFSEHNPLVYTKAAIASYLEAGLSWAEACYRDSLKLGEPAIFYLFTWNCLCGSQVHGHAQAVVHRCFPAPRLALLFDAARRYWATGYNYFDDLWLSHCALGLGLEVGSAQVMASLTPIKERECLILAQKDRSWDTLAQALMLVLTTLQADQPHGLWSFNLAVYSAPLAPVAGWEGFPVLVRVVDRGWPLLSVVDMASMELYAESIVASDPFTLADALRQQAKESS
jgi:hypothetical protein